MANWWEVGKPVAAPVTPAAQEAQRKATDWVNPLAQEAAKKRDLAAMADQFIGYNYNRGTGGIAEALPNWGQPNRQAMEGLTSKMLAATIVPGQSKSMDSNKEMEMALQRLPHVGAQGPVNQDRAALIQREAYLANEKLRAASEWAKSGRSPADFEINWERQLPTIEQRFKYRAPGARAPRSGVPRKGAGVSAMSDAQLKASLGL